MQRREKRRTLAAVGYVPFILASVLDRAAEHFLKLEMIVYEHMGDGVYEASLSSL